MKRILTFFILIFLANISVSQSSFSKEETKEHREKWEKASGTFQIQIVNSRANPQVHISIIEKIESNRSKTEVVYIDYMENIRIMILPTNMISTQEFIPLELFKYVEK